MIKPGYNLSRFPFDGPGVFVSRPPASLRNARIDCGGFSQKVRLTYRSDRENTSELNTDGMDFRLDLGFLKKNLVFGKKIMGYA